MRVRRGGKGFSGGLATGKLVETIVNPVQLILIFAIRAYRLTISPAQSFLFGPTGGCRFTPTCSQYAMDAIRHHGALAGGWMGLKRICRCHPWGEDGHDPVPGAEVRSEKVEGGIILEHTH